MKSNMLRGRGRGLLSLPTGTPWRFMSRHTWLCKYPRVKLAIHKPQSTYDSEFSSKCPQRRGLESRTLQLHVRIAGRGCGINENNSWLNWSVSFLGWEERGPFAKL